MSTQVYTICDRDCIPPKTTQTISKAHIKLLHVSLTVAPYGVAPAATNPSESQDSIRKRATHELGTSIAQRLKWYHELL
jgi:hypothetical protein